jgi:flagellar biosynthesis chaperone FliJ
MLNLFEDVLPWKMFTVFTSKNRVLYLEALFVIRTVFKREMTVCRQELVSLLVSSLDDMMGNIDLSAEDENEDTGDKDTASFSAIAHYIIRHLKSTGWIELEYQTDSFSENVTLPTYTMKILNLLYDLTDESVREYDSFVYSTYTNLKTADQERDDYMYRALSNAYSKTNDLVDELTALHSNIRHYHQQLSEQMSVNQVLEGHFDDYSKNIVEQIYLPLKTLDSVPRFKTPILNILKKWLSDQETLEQLTAQAQKIRKYHCSEEAASDVVAKIGGIIDTYEQLDKRLNEIDQKNNAYTRASIEKMNYLMKSDRSTKGRIIDILKKVAANQDDARETIIEKMGEAVKAYRQSYISNKSLYVRSTKERKGAGLPLEIVTGEEKSEMEAMKAFLSQVASQYSSEKIVNFMDQAMNDRDIITSEEIALPDGESFIMLMLASIKGHDEETFYSVEFTDEYIDNNSYRIPKIRYIRRGDGHVDGLA